MKPFRMLGRRVAIALIASFNVESFTKEIERDLTIVVFLENDTTEEEIAELKNTFEDMPNVDSIEFESKQQVKEQMQQESDVFNTVLSEWDDEESPLRDTYKLKVKDATKISKDAKEIKEFDNVSSVSYGEGMVDRMISAFESIEKITYIVVIALVLVTVFLIINTIKLTISARSREISIMRLVGASNITIKLPFIIEGMILGIIGSIIPILFATYGYIAFYNHFDGHLYSEVIKLVSPYPFIYQSALIVLIIGIIVGMIGSAGAVRRYLKV